MAKTFGKLIAGDKLYRLIISNTITGQVKGNNLNVYKLLRKNLETTCYPSTDIEIGELKIEKIDYLKNSFDAVSKDKINVYFCVRQWTLYERFDAEKSSEIIKSIAGGYRIYSTDKKELLSISKDVVFALREVERNNYLETDRRYREILRKLEKL